MPLCHYFTCNYKTRIFVFFFFYCIRAQIDKKFVFINSYKPIKYPFYYCTDKYTQLGQNFLEYINSLPKYRLEIRVVFLPQKYLPKIVNNKNQHKNNIL